MLVKLCPFFKAEEDEVREKRRVDSRDGISNEKTRAGRKRREALPSSSNCVSTPDGPGTEHTSRALRKVVQRLIRLLLPPTSF